MSSYFKPFHAWEVLAPGESIVMPLPVIDLVSVQQRLTNDAREFRLDAIPVEFGELKTRVTRTK